MSAEILDGTEILLIEDNPEIVGMLVGPLRNEGAKVVSVIGGVAGMARLSAPNVPKFDFIITNYRQVEVPVGRLVRVIRMAQPQAKLVIVSGDPDREKIMGEVNPDGYLPKPFRFADLFEVLGQFIEA